MLTRRLLIFLGLILFFIAGDTTAQSIRFNFDSTPLDRALSDFTTKTGVGVVYSPDLTTGLTTSCRFRGTSARNALICIISGHPFRTQALSRSQIVLVPLEERSGTDKPTQRVVFRGFVRDAASGETLIGAHVVLPSVGAGTITNAAGYFAFPGIESRPMEIAISYLGYARLDTSVVAGDDHHQFQLNPTSYGISGIVIEQDVSRRADLTLTPGLLSVSGRDLKELPGSLGSSDVLESLRWMPGIQRAGEVTGGLLVRGSGPDQNLYLIDGAPVYHPWHAFSLVSTFQTETFKDIAFYRGAFPAEYGGRLSAVLDAELRDGNHSEPQATMAISGLNASFLIESPISEKSSFMLSGRRSYIDKIIGKSHPVSDDLGRRDTLRTGYYFYDWSAKLSFRPDSRSTLSISYYTGGDVLDLRLPFDLSLDFSSWLRPADLFFEIDQHWGNRIVSVRFRRLLSDRVFLTATAYNSEYAAAENTFIKATQSSSVKSAYSVDLQDIGARLDLDYYPSLTHQVKMGASVVRHRFRSDIVAAVAYSPSLIERLDQNSDTETVEMAVYIQDLWRPRADWRILPGIRLSYFGKGRFVRAAPRLSVQYIIDPSWLVLRGAISTHVQYLQRIRDRNSYLYDLVSSRWVPSSKDSKPSRSGQVTAGLESRALPRTVITIDGFARGGQGVLLPKDEFQSKDGLLGPGIEITTLLGQYTKGTERSFGLEFGIDTRLRSWRIIASYTRMRAENRINDEAESEYRPSRFDTPRSFSLVTMRDTRRWKTSISIRWRSGYPVSVPESRYQLVDAISGEATWYFHRPKLNNGRLPAYFRIDTSASYRFRMADADWSFGISLYNLINRRNVIGQTWDPTVNSARPKNRLGLPILPLFELEMTL